MRGLKRYCVINIIVFFLSLIFCASIYAWECDVILSAPDVIKVGQTVTLIAEGTPEGGSYSWFKTPGLVPYGSTARLTGYKPTYSEYILVGVRYTTPEGKGCKDRKWIWVCICYVKISGPDETCVGEPITLSAKGDPSGGAYEWTPMPGLTANGSSAHYIADKPGEVTFQVAYTPPGADEPCYDTHTVKIKGECNVTITGPTVIGIGNFITLNASVSPEGGTFDWTPLPGLIPGTSSADFQGKTPGKATIEVTYETPDGGICSDTHDVMVFDIKSFIPPLCTNSGTTLSSADLNIVTEPAGFEYMVAVKPIYFEALLQSEDNDISACTGSSAASNCITKSISIVNSNVKTTKSISFEIPNYIKKPLEFIGLADKINLSIENNFDDFKECCVFGTAESTDGKTTVGLSVVAGPFTVFGFPLPGIVKKYVTLDALNVTLSGSGNVEINGKYAACEDKTNWSGGGSLKGGIETASEVKAKLSKYIVIQGKLAGSTGVTETLEVLISEIKVTSNWDGLTAAGVIIIKTKWGKIKPYKVSIDVIKGQELPVFYFSLPSLK